MATIAAAAAAAPLVSCSKDREADRRLDLAAGVVSKMVGPDLLPGVVIATGNGVADPSFRAVGTVAPEASSGAVAPDTLFRLYCMTKAVTGLAVMRHVAEGRIQLDQPISGILPEFAGQKVMRGDGLLAPAAREITVRHLLTHTAGLTVPMMSNNAVTPLYLAKGILEPRLTVPALARKRGAPPPSMQAFAQAIASMPLLSEPGACYSYSLSYDVLGAALEKLSGEPLDVHLRRMVLDPLGMDDTVFVVGQRDLPRLSTEMVRMASGAFRVSERSADTVYSVKPDYFEGGNGLVSSPRDFAALMDAVIAPRQAPGELQSALFLLPRDIMPAGLHYDDNKLVCGMATGGAVVRDALPHRVRPGGYYWSGWGGTYFWADFRSGYWMTIMMSCIQASSLKIKDRVTDVIYA